MRSISVRFLPLLFLALTAAAEPRVWFVDNARTNGDGSQAAPFATISAATTTAAPGDVIYVHRGNGPYRERVVLGERQLLAGHGIDLTADLRERGIALPSGLPDLHAAPVIEAGEGDALTLASGSAVAGFRLRTTTGRALVAANVAGDVAVRDAAIETTAGIGVAIEGAAGKIDFARSPISATTGAALVIRNRTGGAVTFHDGSSITVTAGTRDAFLLEANQGELTFADPISISTTGARAIVIRNSSRVGLTSRDNTVATTKASAVDIADTTISIVLRSANVDGAGVNVKRGISLENAPGTFLLAGGAIRNIAARGISIVKSGGVMLQNLVLANNAAEVKATPPCSTLVAEKTLDCAAAIYLAEAADVSVSKTKIDDTGHTAIFGDGVTNLTLDGLTIEDAGDEAGEHGIAIRDLRGRSVLVDSVVKDSSSRQLYISNRGGEGALEIRKTRFDGGPPPAGQQGVLIELAGDAKWSLAVDDSDFAEHFSDGVAVVAGGTSRLETFVHNSRFASTGTAISVVTDGEAQLEYRITSNTIRNATASAISLHTRTSSGNASGTIADNTIAGAKCGSCSGIAVLATRGGRLTTTIRGNNVRGADGYGVNVHARGTAAVSATITGNTIADPASADVLSAIAVQAGALKADTARLCADVSANRISGSWGIGVSGRGSATIAFPAMTGDGADAAAVTQYLRGRNEVGAVKVSGSTTAVKTCQ